MKFRLSGVVLALGLLGGGSMAQVASAITDSVTTFRSVGMIEMVSTSTIPVVVEVPLDTFPVSEFLVVPQSGDTTPVTQVFSVASVNQLAPVTVTDADAIHVARLTDGDIRTTANFPVRTTSGQTTVLFLTTSEVVAATGIAFALAPNVQTPERITIIARTRANEEEIVYQGIFPRISNRVTFPKVDASSWQIVISHTQPLVIAEVELAQVDRPVIEKRIVRFLAQPNESYLLYFNNGVQPSLRSGSQNLLRTNSVVASFVSQVSDNVLFVEQDTDGDGVLDYQDNCLRVQNSDQLDENNNGIGDACEDFDFDRILNYQDNCPFIPNSDQRDSDSDGVGDVCDNDESRLLEKYPWISWLGLIVASLTIGMMFWFVRSLPTPVAREDTTSAS